MPERIRYFKFCPFCKSELHGRISYTDRLNLDVPCQHCGQYYITNDLYNDYVLQGKVNRSQIASYLYYHKLYWKKTDNLLKTPCICLEGANNEEGFQYISMEEIGNWYPKTFYEKVDMFLLNLASRSHFLGDLVLFSHEMLYAAFFVEQHPKGPMGTHPDAIDAQAKFFENYLREQGLVTAASNGFTLQPKGWARVDELQKNQSATKKNVFIAMSFAPEIHSVRDAIKDAIIHCGFIPRIMDEIEHNHQIVPEMLYEIRESRFLIAELSDKNNGAYFEAGYAMGRGKDVIFVCSEEAFDNNAHFDVKQANTITWKDPEDLRDRLIARIKATIS